MKQQEGQNELRRLLDEYEKSLKDCSLAEFRELRYKLKQVMEKIRSANHQGNNR
jgi:hypothetical protein